MGCPIWNIGKIVSFWLTVLGRLVWCIGRHTEIPICWWNIVCYILSFYCRSTWQPLWNSSTLPPATRSLFSEQFLWAVLSRLIVVMVTLLEMVCVISRRLFFQIPNTWFSMTFSMVLGAACPGTAARKSSPNGLSILSDSVHDASVTLHWVYDSTHFQFEVISWL